MKNSVYLGDIDPNNNILPVMDIRRIIMFQLLIWDKIILSDSQFLTDPRLNILMSGYDGDEVCKKYGVSNVSNAYKGIESLFENGLIEVAFRKTPNTECNLLDTWNSMRAGEKKVPYLPEDENYVHYLKSISCNTQTYETTSMSSMFQHKLILGINTDPKKGGLLLQNNDVENELKRMFSARSPLFRNILDFLREQVKNGTLSPDRFAQLYDYVYSCYNVNISAALGCNINTKFAHIPFHIQSGEEYFGNNVSQEQINRLRPTWALNPIFLDYLTFEEFAEIRKHLKTSKVREFYLGSVKSPWAEIEDAWADYTEHLEQYMKLIMYEKKDGITNRMFKEFGNEKYLTNPRQHTVVTPIYEMVKSIVSLLPGISEVIGMVDSSQGIWGSVIALSKRNEKIALAEEYKKISELVSKETRVVTKYDNSFSE